MQTIPSYAKAYMQKNEDKCDFMFYDIHELGFDGLSSFRQLARLVSPTQMEAQKNQQLLQLPLKPLSERPSIIFLDWCVTDRGIEMAWQNAKQQGWLQELGCELDRTHFEKNGGCVLKYCFGTLFPSLPKE